MYTTFSVRSVGSSSP